MNTAGFVITMIAVSLTVLLPRRAAILGILVAVCFITQNQVVDIAVFHFTALRLTLLAALVRIVLRGEHAGFRLGSIDKAVLGYVLVSSAIFCVSRNTFQAFVFQLGFCYDVLFSYFAVRYLLAGQSWLQAFIKPFAILLTVLAVLMTIETFTGFNLFTSFGGLPTEPMYREGHYRSQAAFRSPITAGTLGSTFAPIFLALAILRRRSRFAWLGWIAASLIVITAHSSGPLLSYLAAMLALFAWPWRQNLRVIRIGLVGLLVGLHLVMQAPVWFLLSRVSEIVGGGGWHRAYLIDQAVNHFGSWWLMGTDDTGNWMPYQLEDGTADLTNMYIIAGARAGLIGLFLFILILSGAFKALGKSMESVRSTDRDSEWLLWGFGCALTGTAVNFFCSPYFDQICTVLYLFLAMIACRVDLPSQSEPQRELADGIGLDPDFQCKESLFSNTSLPRPAYREDLGV